MTDIKKLEELVKEELEDANRKFPPFASLHEAYAVILEEFEESKIDITILEFFMDWIWQSIKRNEFECDNIVQIANTAQHAAAELIQVAAMCQKTLDSLETKENNYGDE